MKVGLGLLFVYVGYYGIGGGWVVVFSGRRLEMGDNFVK